MMTAATLNNPLQDLANRLEVLGRYVAELKVPDFSEGGVLSGLARESFTAEGSTLSRRADNALLNSVQLRHALYSAVDDCASQASALDAAITDRLFVHVDSTLTNALDLADRRPADEIPPGYSESLNSAPNFAHPGKVPVDARVAVAAYDLGRSMTDFVSTEVVHALSSQGVLKVTEDDKQILQVYLDEANYLLSVAQRAYEALPPDQRPAIADAPTHEHLVAA